MNGSARLRAALVRVFAVGVVALVALRSVSAQAVPSQTPATSNSSKRLTVEDLRSSYRSGYRAFNQADLGGAHLARMRLRGIELRGANLKNADLKDSDFSDADLTGADMSEADIRNVTLNGVRLVAANLQGAQLDISRLVAADMSGANLAHATLRAIDLRSVRGLKQSALDKACGDENTLLPSGLRVAQCAPNSAYRSDPLAGLKYFPGLFGFVFLAMMGPFMSLVLPLYALLQVYALIVMRSWGRLAAALPLAIIGLWISDLVRHIHTLQETVEPIMLATSAASFGAYLIALLMRGGKWPSWLGGRKRSEKPPS